MIRTTSSKEKRHRNIAHMWADKRILRFFRKNFSKKEYKNLRTTYLALCEIDSDFGEGHEIGGFTRTVATYAGLNADTIRSYLKKLIELGLIEYKQQQNGAGNNFGKTKLILYAWQENPSTGKPVHGKTRPYKNSSKEESSYKNPIRIGTTNPTKQITSLLFEEFWKLYPRKTDKGKAKTRWESLCRKKERPNWRIIKMAIIQQRKTPRWQDPKYIPMASTWINQQRWLDDPNEMVVFGYAKENAPRVDNRAGHVKGAFARVKAKMIERG